MKVLDGRGLYYAFLAGAQRIFENQGLINKINVFPVADADTGTNLASTMRSIVESPIPTDNLKVTAEALADAALVGARGNSGIIFAQFLHGFSLEISDEENYTVESFARSIKNAVVHAYEAIANPVEGTMITVIREWAEFIDAMKELIDDFVEMLIKACHVANESLLATTRKLEVLAKANVVDAGAKGFVLFLEGMIDFFKNRQTIRKLSMVSNEMQLGEIAPDTHDEITFRYCCEALLSIDRKKGESKDLIRDAIAPLGDSIVVAGSESRARIHIHTDNPIELFDIISANAGITYQKVDDMVMQQKLAHERKWPVALLTDSTCDLPDELIEKYQISMVPLNLHAGKSQYLDRTTISTSMFYDRLDTFPEYPSTSQPSYKDFINKYAYLSSHFDSTIAIHVSRNLSGTCSNSSKAAKAVSEQAGKKIHVQSSNNVASGLGLLVLRVARAIEAGLSHDEITASLDEWTRKNHLLVSTNTIKYLVKSGRLSYSKGILARFLGVNPVITVDKEGRGDVFSKPFGEKKGRQMIINDVKKKAARGKIWGYSISHIRNEEGARWFAGEMEKIVGKKPEFISECSPVLGVNGGPGLVALAFMEE